MPLLPLLLTLSVVSPLLAGETLDLTIPPRHRPQVVMGRDYWPALYKYGDWAYNTNYIAWVTYERSVRFDNPEVNAIPAFRDAMPIYYGRRPPPPAESGRAVWRNFADNFGDDERDREILTANPAPDRPLMVQTISKRDFLSWAGKADLDRAAYGAFRAAHPNLLVDGAICEWDNDLMMAFRRVKNVKDPVRRRELEEFLGAPPQTRTARADLMRRFFRRIREHCYGGVMDVEFAHIYSCHLAADAGAAYLELETTNSSGSPTDDDEYRWNTAAMFARGAVRQFRTRWEWYIAGYMNGYMSDGSWKGNVVCMYPGRDSSPDSIAKAGWYAGPEWGQSANVLRRAFFFAYLNGANFTEMEEWSAQFLRWDRAAKKTVLSPRAKFYIDYHDFTVAHPNRGVTWTPVAICLPIAQGYTAWGGWPWSEETYGYTEADHQVDAVFYTLVPGFERAKAMARGAESNLHNTRYAAMYDVICPDAKSPTPEDLLETMKGYRALVVAGDYPDRSFEKTLAKYEAAGGRVIRIGAREVPKMAKDARGTIRDLQAGRARHPAVERIFDGLQKDYFPFRVDGDCLYGFNVQDATRPGAKAGVKGWLWIFNNRGVTKFGDRPELIDASAAARVTVAPNGCRIAAAEELVAGEKVAVADGGFSAVIPAGDLRIFEIR